MSYKVVKESPGEGPISCRVGCYRTLRTVYQLDKWIRPPHGPALVFDTLKNAISFSKDTSGYSDFVYRCRTKERKAILVVLKSCRDPFSPTSVLDRLRAFWKGELKGATEIKAPKGTYSAEEVMLTKRIGKAIA